MGANGHFSLASAHHGSCQDDDLADPDCNPEGAPLAWHSVDGECVDMALWWDAMAQPVPGSKRARVADDGHNDLFTVKSVDIRRQPAPRLAPVLVPATGFELRAAQHLQAQRTVVLRT